MRLSHLISATVFLFPLACALPVSDNLPQLIRRADFDEPAPPLIQTAQSPAAEAALPIAPPQEAAPPETEIPLIPSPPANTDMVNPAPELVPAAGSGPSIVDIAAPEGEAASASAVESIIPVLSGSEEDQVFNTLFQSLLRALQWIVPLRGDPTFAKAIPLDEQKAGILCADQISTALKYIQAHRSEDKNWPENVRTILNNPDFKGNGKVAAIFRARYMQHSLQLTEPTFPFPKHAQPSHWDIDLDTGRERLRPVREEVPVADTPLVLVEAEQETSSAVTELEEAVTQQMDRNGGEIVSELVNVIEHF